MPMDFGGPPHYQQVVDLSKLPEVLSIEIRRRRFEKPRRVTREGVDHFVSVAIEFVVKVSAPFPVRALGPALWVGDEALTSADADGLTYHFFAFEFEFERLKEGAPISLGWSSPSESRKKTKYRFAMPGEPRAQA